MYDKVAAVRLGQQFKKVYDKKLVSVQETYQLTRVDLDILIFLNNHNNMDRAKDIVKCRMIAKSAVSKAIDELIQRGYITSHMDDHDRRTTHLTVTEKAKDVVLATERVQEEICQVLYHGSD